MGMEKERTFKPTPRRVAVLAAMVLMIMGALWIAAVHAANESNYVPYSRRTQSSKSKGQMIFTKVKDQLLG